MPLQVEYPDLLDWDWRDGSATCGQVTATADRDGITFSHAKHGRLKVIPA